jgi:exodeoxyribonuclease V alpha subunit
VDEASMIDISLMAKLLRALPAKARVILLGDSQQLASVESGAVLANLCGQQPVFSSEFCQQLQQFADIDLAANNVNNMILCDSVVLLQHSYRFDQHSLICTLAKAVQKGNNKQVLSILSSAKEPIWHQQPINHLLML